MAPFLLIIYGLIIIGLTIWDVRRERADMLFWVNFFWWDVNKIENPLLFRIAIAIQLLGALLIITVGVVWLIYFR